ncbi:Polyamine N-acetyltransferase 1 [Pelomyxa schiedti]|nr:Polyamine N-acetyltransferase 1 [Pelomyxa schiedti]
MKAAREEQIDELYGLESTSYPEDEAAERDTMLMRMRVAPDCFRVLNSSDVTPDLVASLPPTASIPLEPTIIGFINGTLARGELTKETMHHHDPDGTTLCIHSVVTRPSLRRHGIALWMLSQYLHHIASAGSCSHVNRVCLLCKPNLIGLYSRAGFGLMGPSPVQHGKEQWMLMSMPLSHH